MSHPRQKQIDGPNAVKLHGGLGEVMPFEYSFGSQLRWRARQERTMAGLRLLVDELIETIEALSQGIEKEGRSSAEGGLDTEGGLKTPLQGLQRRCSPFPGFTRIPDEGPRLAEAVSDFRKSSGNALQ